MSTLCNVRWFAVFSFEDEAIVNIMTESLYSENLEFIDILLKSGLSLRNFLSPQKLRDLYNITVRISDYLIIEYG